MSEDGTILEISQYGNPDGIACAEFYSGLLVPGLINAHCHLELSYLKDAIPAGCGYTGFAAGMSSVRETFSTEERLYALAAADSALWKQGVSGVADISNGASSFAAKSRSGIYYHSFLELFGLNARLDVSLGQTASHARESGLVYSSTPHSLYSLEDGPFREAVVGFDHNGEMFSEDKMKEIPPLSVHFMESPGEAELFDGRGEMRKWYEERGWNPEFPARYGSPADRLIALVPAERDIMLIHNCCVTEEDVDKISGHFKGRVTWVLCPRSNRYITGLTPPAELLMRKGANIAIGTDSLASNRSLDMVGELCEFSGIPLEELLGWATVNGARALGMENRLGSLETGTKPGIALITGIDWEKMTLTPGARSERIF